MKKLLTISVFVILALSALIWMFNFSTSMDIDACLDSGGSWDYDKGQCDGGVVYGQSQAIFEVKNQSDDTIKNLCFSAHENCDYLINILPHDNKRYILNMENIPKVDGDYELNFNLGDTSIFKQFGYYTNGWSTEKSTVVEISNDTIIFEFIF